MRLLALTLVFASLTLFNNTALAQGNLLVTYLQPQSQQEENSKKLLTQSNITNRIKDLINQQIILSKNIEIIIGADDGPLFDPESVEIWLPYSFIEDTRTRFKNDNYLQTGVSPKEATIDSIAHTLLHEVGHALIAMYDLPIVGKEEDAADSLAVVLLTHFMEEGGDMAISAADLFELEGEEIEEFDDNDFWSEHSLDIQRYYNTLCHVYGSDPQRYQEIIELEILSEDKADQCINDYDIVSRSWINLLSPYLRE